MMASMASIASITSIAFAPSATPTDDAARMLTALLEQHVFSLDGSPDVRRMARRMRMIWDARVLEETGTQGNASVQRLASLAETMQRRAHAYTLLPSQPAVLPPLAYRVGVGMLEGSGVLRIPNKTPRSGAAGSPR